MPWKVAIVAAIIVSCAVRAAGADGRQTGGCLLMFPLDGVNVAPSSAGASTEVLVSALRSRGVQIADLEGPGAAGPPSAPLAPREKGALAQAHGCSGYLDGKLVRLGALIRVSVNERGLDGRVLESREAEAKNDDDVVGVLERISEALAGGGSVDETLTLDNATVVETQRKANAFRMENNFGMALGGIFGVGDTMDTGMLLAFDGRLETGDLLVVLNVGIVVAAADRYDDFWGSSRIDRDYDYAGDATDYHDSKLGVDMHPTIGLELVRHSSIRVHFELRYACDFSERGRFGHGPLLLAGIAF